MTRVGSVAEVWRYPVKSLVGERLTTAAVERRGVVGDRRWAVTDADGKLGSGKSTRRFRRMDGLLELAARYDDRPVPVIGFPDGRRIAVDDPTIHAALSEHVGRPVRLRAEDEVPHHDEGPLHLVTQASLAATAAAHGSSIPVERVRPSLLIEVQDLPGFVEDGWLTRELAVGSDVVVRVRGPMPRCIMVEQAQSGLPAARGLLDTLGRVHAASLGVVADVVHAGQVSGGDEVVLL